MSDPQGPELAAAATAEAEAVVPAVSHWRRSLGAKITAIGFIILILMGNFWLMRAVLGLEPQVWLRTAFTCGVLLVAVGGLLLVVSQARKLYSSFTGR